MGSYVNVTSAASTNNGNFLYTGFKPAWFMNKMLRGPECSGGWFLYDNKRSSYNLTGNYLVPNETYAQNESSEGWEFLSNGIKLRAEFGANVHMWMAFAESPFKYSNARKKRINSKNTLGKLKWRTILNDLQRPVQALV